MRKNPTSTGVGLKLGKGAAFVKRRLRDLPQSDDVWEAGFRKLPSRRGTSYGWLGTVVSLTDDYLLAELLASSPPTVNDLAKLLADAMRRPIVEQAHRPATIRLDPLPEWSELIPHLEQIGIETVPSDELPLVDAEAASYSRDVIEKL